MRCGERFSFTLFRVYCGGEERSVAISSLKEPARKESKGRLSGRFEGGREKVEKRRGRKWRGGSGEETRRGRGEEEGVEGGDEGDATSC